MTPVARFIKCLFDRCPPFCVLMKTFKSVGFCFVLNKNALKSDSSVFVPAPHTGAQSSSGVLTFFYKSQYKRQSLNTPLPLFHSAWETYSMQYSCFASAGLRVWKVCFVSVRLAEFTRYIFCYLMYFNSLMLHIKKVFIYSSLLLVELTQDGDRDTASPPQLSRDSPAAPLFVPGFCFSSVTGVKAKPARLSNCKMPQRHFCGGVHPVEKDLTSGDIKNKSGSR